MKQAALTIVIICLSLSSCKKSIAIKKESYSVLIDKAMQLSKDEDSLKLKEALVTYQNAFNKFPDSIDDYSKYNVSVIASRLKMNDVAFKYLQPLAELIEDDEGYPGWDYILGDYATEDYSNLFNDKRWSSLKQAAILNQTQFFDNLSSDEAEFFSTKKGASIDSLSAERLYNYIKSQNNFLPKKKKDYSISFQINDTSSTSYFVHLPKTYNPNNQYPMLVFLHGAIRYTTLSDYETKSNLKYANTKYTKRADANDVVLVFPKADKNFNWMIGDEGFFMVPEIIKQIKSAINIDDDKVFVSGHSNGATGSFSYLMKQPTQFAGFYGFNTHPKVYTGGTFIENVKARSFINFSTDQDYYYPPNANDSLNSIMSKIKADYKDYRYNGFPHWFPDFDEAEPAYDILFEDLIKRKRNPFSKTLQWEFDDNAHGTIDWLNIIKLDTIKTTKVSQKPTNFKITKWLKLDDNDNAIVIDVNQNAFDFPRQSAKITAKFTDNVFDINTEKVGSFTIYISPEMVDLSKPIKVIVNNVLVFEKIIDYDDAFMIDQWNANMDRSQLWVNNINITLH
ncbi:alpha/beta hydrolase-fold protein [Olleya sp. AS48]|uniref:alpha/beta hydrolase-fold protein n=1 Tax=Olleya sp. AS48 TaxID=3135774 RepID=UPI0031740F10